MVTPEVQFLARCIKELNDATNEMLETYQEVKKLLLKLNEKKEAHEKERINYYDASLYSEQELRKRKDRDIPTIEKEIMSLFSDEKVKKNNFIKAKEEEIKVDEEYKKAINIKEIAEKKYYDAVKKVELAWEPAKDSITLGIDYKN